MKVVIDLGSMKIVLGPPSPTGAGVHDEVRELQGVVVFLTRAERCLYESADHPRSRARHWYVFAGTEAIGTPLASSASRTSALRLAENVIVASR